MSRTRKALENNKFKIGDQNGKLTIVGDFQYVKFKEGERPACYVRCECGVEKFIRLRCFSTTNSCGCSAKVTHGEAKFGKHSNLYDRWILIKQRCSNSKTPNYHRYGGRGITICDEWKNNYVAFRDWSLRNGYSEELELDRKDNDGNYTPDNCRWVTHAENCANK